VSAELEVLQDAVARLEGAGIAYMLTGSVALSYYAEPRMTRDVDLVVELADRDPRSITALFAPDYYVAQEDVARAIAARAMFNVLHLGKVVKLDLIVRKDTDYRRREFERRRRAACGRCR
jgi:cytochrome c-type biogenesis protein CcmH/NrfG